MQRRRSLRWALSLLATLGLAVAMSTAISVRPALAATALILKPTSGYPTASFTAIAEWDAPNGCASTQGGTAYFYWDRPAGTTTGAILLSTVPMTFVVSPAGLAYWTVTTTLTPPATDNKPTPNPYNIAVDFCVFQKPSGTSVSAGYTIVPPPPPPSPPPPPPPTPPNPPTNP